MGELDITVPTVHPGRIWDMVGEAGLLAMVGSVSNLSQVPMVVMLTASDGPKDAGQAVASTTGMTRFFMGRLASLTHLPAVELARTDLFDAAHSTAAAFGFRADGDAPQPKGTLAHHSPFGLNSIKSVPILLQLQSGRVVLGAVAVLVVDRNAFDSRTAMQAELSLYGPLSDPDGAKLWDTLPDQQAVASTVQLLGDLVGSYCTAMEKEVSLRLELASEQARSRQLLLRVENLEQQVVSGRSEIENVSDFGDLPTSQLEAILSIPEIGVIIEDTSYRIRYLNPYMRKHFGDAIGRLCYEAINGRTSVCEVCPIKKLWGEGKPSWRYSTRSPDSGDVFEVVSVPFMSKRGEKMVLEVGLNMTHLHKELNEVKSQLASSKERNTQLQELTRSLNMVVFDYFQEIQEVLAATSTNMNREKKLFEELFLDQSLPLAGWDALLTSTIQRLLALVAESRRLSLSLGSVGIATTVDVRALLMTMSGGTGGLWRGLPVPEVGAIPPIETNRAALAILLGVWIRSAIERAGPGSFKPLIWHLHSGHSDGVTPGDAFHILALRIVEEGRTRRTERYAKRGQAGQPFDGSQAALLARYLGGHIREEAGPHGKVSYLTLPKVPPADMRRL